MARKRTNMRTEPKNRTGKGQSWQAVDSKCLGAVIWGSGFRRPKFRVPRSSIRVEGRLRI